MSQASATGTTTEASGATATGLRPNAIGFMGVLIQSVALIGPGVAIAFGLGPGITYAGGSFPLSIALAMVAALLLAVSIGQLAIQLPSAGGFYTYISRSLGRSLGFLAGWISIPAYLLFLPLNLLAFGYALQQASGGSMPLWMGAIALAVITGLLTFFGVRLSIRTLVVLGAIEVLVFTVLSVFLVGNSANSNALDAFTPTAWGARGGVSGVLVGAVIAVLFFNGFESAVLLSEESKHPRKIIQPALLIAVLLTGVVFILASYAGLASFGFDPNAYLADTSGSPWFTLGAQAWGTAGKYIVQLVVLNSLIANCLAGFTALSRVTFAMGRAGALPKALGRVNRRFRTPTLALLLGVLAAIGIALWSYSVYGDPPKSFLLLLDTAAYCVIVNFAAVSLAAPFFFLRQRRSEFRALPHLVAPLIAVLLLVAVLGAQFLAATNPDQYPGLLPQYLGTIIVGGWLALGIVLVLALRVWRSAALEAGERIYLVTEAPPATLEASSVSQPLLEETPETAELPDAPEEPAGAGEGAAAPVATEPQAREIKPALDSEAAPALGETLVVAEAEPTVGEEPSALLERR
jgi:amino acid transporter